VSLIVWDEASMTKRQEVEALDNIICDLMNEQELPFKRRMIVFSGDFIQTLLVVRKDSHD
jgi:ATP-dependent DNA helicase PIF1